MILVCGVFGKMAMRYEVIEMGLKILFSTIIASMSIVYLFGLYPNPYIHNVLIKSVIKDHQPRPRKTG
jgi:hypothetical protein